jgi:hypothetical protein
MGSSLRLTICAEFPVNTKFRSALEPYNGEEYEVEIHQAQNSRDGSPLGLFIGWVFCRRTGTAMVPPPVGERPSHYPHFVVSSVTDSDAALQEALRRLRAGELVPDQRS